MATDLEIIEELEQEIGRKLERKENDFLMIWKDIKPKDGRNVTVIVN